MVSDDDDSDDDEDDTEALLAELEQIKKERAEEKLRKVSSRPLDISNSLLGIYIYWCVPFLKESKTWHHCKCFMFSLHYNMNSLSDKS